MSEASIGGQRKVLTFATYTISGLDCANCAAKLELELRKHPGLENSTVNYATQTMTLAGEHLDSGSSHDSVSPAHEKALSLVSTIEPEAILSEKKRHGHHDQSQAVKKVHEANSASKVLGALGFAWAFIVMVASIIWHDTLHQVAGQPQGAWLAPWIWLEWPIVVSAYLPVAWPVLSGAWRRIIRGDFFDENFLMSIATLGAFAIHELPEALGVMVFFTVGEWFQDRAVAKSRSSIQALVDLRPDSARLWTSDRVELVDPATIMPGSLIEVRPGERLALDGTVESGTAWVDTSALTGESLARRAEAGSPLSAGVLISEGVLHVRTTALLEDSASSRILRLVEDATNRKAPAERFITRFAKVYTPFMVFSALALALLPPLLGFGTLAEWTYRALVLLVISCPCALVISIPLGYFGGLGAASRAGILVKGAQYLDRLASVSTVVFDKTGTLSKGNFTVHRISVPQGENAHEVLALAAALEEKSSHPIARSICTEAKNRALTVVPATDIREIRGKGISASLGGVAAMAGTARFLENEGGVIVPETALDTQGTQVHLASAGKYRGTITIGDELRAEAKQALTELTVLGVKRQVILSGDRIEVVQDCARELGVAEYYGELLPGDKLDKVEALLAEPGIGTLAFVGDGINDAPVLKRADLGIAMGGLGSDAAIEAADMVLMDDKLDALGRGVSIARKTRRIVFQNIVFALAVKAMFLTMGSLGMADLWEAVIADVGVALLAVLNASRALRHKAS